MRWQWVVTDSDGTGGHVVERRRFSWSVRPLVSPTPSGPLVMRMSPLRLYTRTRGRESKVNQSVALGRLATGRIGEGMTGRARQDRARSAVIGKALRECPLG